MVITKGRDTVYRDYCTEMCINLKRVITKVRDTEYRDYWTEMCINSVNLQKKQIQRDSNYVQYSNSNVVNRDNKHGFTLVMFQCSLFLNKANKIYELANVITIISARCQGEPSEVHKGTKDVPFIMSPTTAASSHKKPTSVVTSCNGLHALGHHDGQIL